ncbi:glucan endo-1,3-beta-glucosidase precursor [Streptomyces turgidiscabies]|nr:glucan endo-1,3-beta-glucosidase precursor [Streptomyces turgidiscabies]
MPSPSVRDRRGGLTCRLTLFATAVSLLVAIPTVRAAALDPAGPSTGGPMLVAQTEAASSGQAVPIDDLTTQTSTVTANPDGSFTSVTDLMPVRVLKDGAWTPVDASLAANPDGTISPAATPNSVSLSGGGTGPLVTLTHADGHSLALTMPFALPAPTLDGDTALYSSVLPGVDLSVSVTDQGGFSDVLILHDAAAAADPEVKKLSEAATADGLTLSATPSGGMDALTADGAVAYTSPRPLMWDSSTAPTTLSKAAASAAITAADDDPTASSADGPGIGANVDTVPMATTSGGLTLTPDTAVLSDPDTNYPVYIDPFTNPVTSTSGHYDEVYSSSTCSDSPQYDKPQTNGQGVGYQQWGGSCGNGVERSYYAINTSGLDPAMVVSEALITVSTTYAASWDCSHNQPITLHTIGPINSSTDWNSHIGVQDDEFKPVGITIPSAANPGSGCSNHTASFTVPTQAQKIADKGTTTWFIGLYGNETASSGNEDYLRMSSSLKLTTTFDIPPDVPTNRHTIPSAAGAGGDCVTSGDGWIGAITYSTAGSNIQLHSKVVANVSGELVDAYYHVWDRTVLDSSGNAVTMSNHDSGNLASGTDADTPIGFTLKDGHEYGWHVYAMDNSTAHLVSAASSDCWFKTDFTPPDTPDIATNPTFPPVGSGSAQDYAGPGKTTDFTVTASDGIPADTCSPNACLASGVDHFLWQLDSQPTTATGSTAPITSTDSQGMATATVTIPVRNWGVHTLYVAAVDKAGNISQAPVAYTFAAPWNPTTRIQPGDITGDGTPDLLATTSTGDLELIPGNTDAAQPAAPAQTGPISGTAPAITRPVIVSTAADSPTGTWNDYLIAHRGNLHGADVDDLFAYNKQTSQLYIVKNDLDPADDSATPRVDYSTYPGYVGKRFDVVAKDACAASDVVADSTRCRTADYNTQSWNIAQLLTPGNVYGNKQNYPAVITVENKRLWMYQTDGGGHLTDPVLLGDGDWSGMTLIGAGTTGGAGTADPSQKCAVNGGTPTLWARDNNSGTLYTYSIKVDPATCLPPLLHPPTRTPLTSSLTAVGGGSLCLADPSASLADDTAMILWNCNGHAEQEFTLRSDSTVRVLGHCLSAENGGTSTGTQAVIDTCDGSAPQKWSTGTNGRLVNTSSGLCLADPSASTTPGTQQILWTCGSAGQNWNAGSAGALPAGNAQTNLVPLLPARSYPSIASPGDVNSATGDPDGNPDLYTVDTSGQLTEHVGDTPDGTTARFTSAPVSLGTVTNTATHCWNLSDGTGTTAADPTGDLPATLHGASSWSTDATRGTTLNLSGTSGYADTGGPAVDTSGSFTVSAWVKLNSLSANSTVISQSDGPAIGAANGFQLYYSSGAQVWAFGRHDDDTTTSAFTAAYGAKASLGHWTHLVGVYDADTSRLSLYADGRLSATKAFTGLPWNATGSVQIGRSLAQGSYGQYGNARISDIHIYDTALPPADASAPGDNLTVTELD